MPKRLGLVAAALAVAAALSLLLVFAGGDPTVTSRPGPAPANPTDLSPFAGADNATDIDGLANREIVGPGTAERGEYVLDAPNRRTTLTYQTLTPLPRGAYETTEPAAEIQNPDRTRVITIAADAGRFLAPQNQLREGQFEGNVVLSLYESDNDDPVDLDRPPRLRVHLVDARFDAQLGTVESDDDVLVTAPDFEFRGRQLALVYSDLRQQLSRLEVAQGESLIFNPDALDRPAPQPQTTDIPGGGEAPGGDIASDKQDKSKPAKTKERKPKKEDAPRAAETRDPAEPSSETEASEPTPLYTAVFERDVRVDAPDAAIDADLLAITFALDRLDTTDDDTPRRERQKSADQAGEEKPARNAKAADREPPPAAAPSTQPVDPTPPATQPARVVASTPPSEPVIAAPDEPADTEPAIPADPRSLFVASPDDVTVTWTGPLVVEPADRTPDDFADADDAYIRLQGSPVRIRTTRGESVVAPLATYQRSTGRVTAEGTAALPARVVSADGAALVGRSVVLNAATGDGTILGPGTLTAAPDGDPDPGTATQIAFADTLDLTFAPPQANRKRSDRLGGPTPAPDIDLGPLATAAFRGPVRIDDPRLTLTAERSLTARFFTDTSSPRLRQIDAVGDVAVTGADNQDGYFELDADELLIDFALDAEGREQPASLTARRDVAISSPELRLACDTLDVELADPALTPSPDRRLAGSTDESLDRIESLTAAGSVDLELLEPGLTLAGDRLVVDAAHDQAELFGDPIDADRWATATQQDDRGPSVLAGPHLVFRQADRSARVPGPGTFTTPLPSDNPQAESEQSEGSGLRVAWQRAMTFFDAAGQARFLGEVVATTSQPDATSRLTADDLRLAFTPLPDPESPDPQAATPPDEPRQLLTASATSPPSAEPPAFTYASRDPDTDQLLTRLTLQGDALNLDNTTGRPALTVPSPGRMLLEDYRPGDRKAEATANAEKDEGRRTEDRALTSPAGDERAPTAEDTNRDDRDPSSFVPRPSSLSPDPLAAFSGRGATLILFDDTLLLTAGPNTLDAVGDVQLVHQPAGQTDPDRATQLDAQRLVVDLADRADLGPMFTTNAQAESEERSDEGSDLQVDQIDAHGAVRIVDGNRRVNTDHLRYTAADNTAWLWSGPGRTTRVTDDRYPAGLSGQSIYWDLDRDRLELRRPGPGLLPIPEQVEEPQINADQRR